MSYPLENLVECTADEWADFCSLYDYYNTEGRKNVSSDKDHPLLTIVNDTVIGMVRYHDNIHKTYYINKNYAGPTKR